jgi:hypothetical protein
MKLAHYPATHHPRVSCPLTCAAVIPDLRALAAALSPECLGPEAPGGRRQECGGVWDHARGGKVCLLHHLPPNVAKAISDAILNGTLGAGSPLQGGYTRGERTELS